MTVAAIGHANPNKRIDEILMAIGSSPMLRGRCRLRVIGEATEGERARLDGIAAALGVMPPEFTGWVDDEDLRWQLRDVDVIACLRNPVLEGASASVIAAMISGRPTLVTAHGCYAEIPADAVLACRPEAEALDAMRHLEWVLAHPAKAAAIGARARDLALTRHAPAAYADKLLALLQQVVAEPELREKLSRELPRREARRQLLSTLQSLGLGAEDPAVARMDLLFQGMGLTTAKLAVARRIANRT